MYLGLPNQRGSLRANPRLDSLRGFRLSEFGTELAETLRGLQGRRPSEKVRGSSSLSSTNPAGRKATCGS